MDRSDVVIIGAGQAAKPLALALAREGRRCALIEREEVGGSCINYGCTPTKAMVASARVAHLVRRAGDFGVEVDDAHVDMARVRARARRIVEDFRASSEGSLEDERLIDLIYGEARFTGPREVSIALQDGGARRLRGDVVVLDTGTRPRVPALPGLDRVPWLDNASILDLDAVPGHLVVLGGGSVGVEFAQIFRRFGARVTVVEQGPQLLGDEDEDAAAAIRDLLVAEGIEVRLGAEALRVDGDADALRLTVRGEGGDEETITGTHLLVAVGRAPNTDALDLAAAGVEVDARGYVRVDEHLATSAADVYAVGDVRGGPAYTHMSYDDYRVLRANLLEGADLSVDDRLVPAVVFTDPELARVGLGEREARARGLDVEVHTMAMKRAARALELGVPRGFIKAVVERDTQRILGVTLLGVHGGELMSTLEVAMLGDVRATQLRDAIFAHPTLAESLNTLFEGH